MKKHYIKALSVFFAFILFASCNDQAVITRLGTLNFPGTFKGSTNSVVITATNDSLPVVTFNWAPVSYGIKAAVTYSLQFDIPSDTASTTPWSKATDIPVGDDLLTFSMLGVDLNNIAINSLGLSPGVVAEVVVRVKSYVDRPAYSNAITLSVNPYVPPAIVVGQVLWVTSPGWNIAASPTIVSVDSGKLYEGYVYIPAGGSTEIKYTSNPDLTHIVYGDGGAGLLSKDKTAGYLNLPSDGYYELSANLNDMSWTATKITWSILGDASPGLWATDTPLTYDPTTKVWTVTCAMITAGSFKFRANNAWKIDFGIDANGKLGYVDNPLYPYNGKLSNLTVPSDGNYTITLDLHVPGQYSYKLKKN